MGKYMNRVNAGKGSGRRPGARNTYGAKGKRFNEKTLILVLAGIFALVLFSAVAVGLTLTGVEVPDDPPIITQNTPTPTATPTATPTETPTPTPEPTPEPLKVFDYGGGVTDYDGHYYTGFGYRNILPGSTWKVDTTLTYGWGYNL